MSHGGAALPMNTDVKSFTISSGVAKLGQHRRSNDAIAKITVFTVNAGC
jgi:hypothetical protein